MSYNASVKQTKFGEDWGIFVAEVVTLNGRPQMVRSNSVQCTGYEGLTFKSDDPDGKWKAGDAVYDWYMRAASPNSNFEIILDNCNAYRNKLSGMALPPAYRV